MKLHKLLAVTAAAAAIATLPAASASAAPGFDPAQPKTANPAQTCAFIAGYAEAFTGSTPAGFTHAGCTKLLAKGAPSIPFLGDPRAACARMEEDEEIAYPYAFYQGAPSGAGFPGLIAHDRSQCARALYAFHTLVQLLSSGE